MNYSEFRQWIESMVPWWGPFVIPVLALVYYVGRGLIRHARIGVAAVKMKIILGLLWPDSLLTADELVAQSDGKLSAGELPILLTAMAAQDLLAVRLSSGVEVYSLSPAGRRTLLNNRD